VKRSIPNAYFFIFREIQITDSIENCGFYLIKENVLKLQRLVSENIHVKKRKQIEITLPYGDKVLLTFRKQRVQFLLWNGYQLKFTMFFNKEQVEQLFGGFWEEVADPINE
jgi:hypothetical protein